MFEKSNGLQKLYECVNCKSVLQFKFELILESSQYKASIRITKTCLGAKRWER